MPKKKINTYKDKTPDSASEEENVEGFTQILREIRVPPRNNSQFRSGEEGYKRDKEKNLRAG